MAGEKRRHQMIADRKLQGTLLAHATIYWFYCLFSVTLIAVCWIFFTNQPESSSELFTQLWVNCGPALLGSILLLPLVLLDCLRLSNRFAGPMVRMQRVMRELASGEAPESVKLRPGDFWCEFADDINMVMERLRRQELQIQTTRPSSCATSQVVSSRPAPNDSKSAAGSTSVLPIGVPLDGQSTTESIYSDLSV